MLCLLSNIEEPTYVVKYTELALALRTDENRVSFSSVISSARLDVQLIPEKITQSLWNTGNLMFSLVSSLEQLVCMEGILERLTGLIGFAITQLFGVVYRLLIFENYYRGHSSCLCEHTWQIP